MKLNFIIEPTGENSAIVRCGSRRAPIEWQTEEQKQNCIHLAKDILIKDRQKMESEGFKNP